MKFQLARNLIQSFLFLLAFGSFQSLHAQEIIGQNFVQCGDCFNYVIEWGATDPTQVTWTTTGGGSIVSVSGMNNDEIVVCFDFAWGVEQLIASDANGNVIAEAVIEVFGGQVFIVGPQSACTGECITLFAEDDCGQGGFYNWSVEHNGVILNNIGTSQVIDYCFFEEGIYTFYLDDATGQTTSWSITVASSSSPEILYSPASFCPADSLNPEACTEICAYSEVNYFLDGQYANSEVGWSISGANDYEIQPDGLGVSVQWGATGTGSVSVFVEGNNCSGENTLCVNILDTPTSQFTTIPAPGASALEVCEGQSVAFVNQSTLAETYVWGFGDLTYSTDFSTEHTYDTPGSYEVMLIARNACFCADTSYLNVTVTPAERPDIQCTGTVCSGDAVTYTTDAACTGFAWSVSANGVITDGGGAADNFITIQWNSGPEGTIELGVSGCTGSFCSAPTVMRIPILIDNAPIDGPVTVCKGDVVAYQMADFDGTDYAWNVSGWGTILSGQGSNKIIVEWNPQAVANNNTWVEVDYENCWLECGGSSHLDVAIRPQFYITGEIEACANETYTFNAKNGDTQGAALVNWEVIAPDGSSTLLLSNSSSTPVNWANGAGRYTMRATPANPADFCSESAELIIAVNQEPDAPLGIDGSTNICVGETYTYEANANNPINAFEWTINDGGITSTEVGTSINITWNSGGPYSVAVKEISTVGLTCASADFVLNVNAIGAVTLTGDIDRCQDQAGNYSATYYENVTYNWSITPADAGSIVSGDGTENIEIFWHNYGFNTVSVEVCGAVENLPVTVNPTPEPQVTHPVGLCVGTLGPVATTTPFATYNWKNEAGTSVSMSANPSLEPGYYEVEVTTIHGCLGSTTFNIEAYPVPEVFISTPESTGICAGDPFPTIYAEDTNDGYTYQWYYNNAPIAGATGNTHTAFEGLGFYYVVVTDVNGCINNSNSLEVFEDCDPPPGVCNGGTSNLPDECEPSTHVTFIYNNFPDCNTFKFTNTSSDYVAGTEEWDFGDGTSSTDQNPEHSYTRAGFYTVVLLALHEDSPGIFVECWEANIIEVQIAADFKAEIACAGEETRFEDLTTHINSNSITNWKWTFDDPTSAQNLTFDQNPTHEFTAPGSYEVTMIATHSSGCTSTYIETVVIPDFPTGTFATPAQTCQGAALAFDALLDSDVTSVEWDFAGLQTSESANTFYAFENPGNYNVTLTSYNVYGCSQSYTSTVVIEPNDLTGNVNPAAPAPLCEGDNVQLTAPAGGISYVWSSGEVAQSILVDETGVYEVTITDSKGCTYVPPAVNVDVLPLPEAEVTAVEFNEFGQAISVQYNSYSVCHGSPVFLQMEAVGNYNYSWSNGGIGPAIELSEERDTELEVGTHNFTVTVTDVASGCQSLTGFQVIVHPNPGNILVTANPVGDVCSGTPTTFSVSSPDPTFTYIWNTGDTGPMLTTPVAGKYWVKAINQFGCEGESDQLVIHEVPDIGKVPSGCHTRCKPDTLCLPTVQNVVTYQWYYEGTMITGANGNNPNLEVWDSGDYWVEMTDIYGCSSTSDPLSLDLYDGYGNILGGVYDDVNMNGVLDSGDTLVPNITINLDATTSVNTDLSGNYTFTNILSTDYDLTLDTMSLPIDYQAYYTTADVELIGCDDEEEAHWLIYKVCEPSYGTFNNETCQGEAYDYNGTMVMAGTTEEVTLISAAGCDSLVTVTIAALMPSTNSESFNTCFNTPYDYNGTMLAPGSSTDFVVMNSVGCDSTITVSIIEIAELADDVALTTCNATPIDYNGTMLNPNTTTDFTYTSYTGCDSMVTVVVTEALAIEEDETFLTCNAIPIDYNGTMLNPNTTTDFTYTSFTGCDSIVTVVVNETTEIESSFFFVDCENDGYNHFGTVIMPGDTEEFVYSSFAGCDSTVTINITANPNSITPIDLEVCEGDEATFGGQLLAIGTTTEFAYTDINGCDSLVYVSVSAFAAPSFELVGDEICKDATDGEVSIQNLTGTDGPYEASINNGPFDSGTIFIDQSVGTHTIQVRDANGCIYEEEVTITPSPDYVVDMGTNELPCNGADILIEPRILTGDPTAVTYLWSDGSTEPSLMVDAVGTYEVEITTPCEVISRSVAVAYEAYEGRANYLYFPNAFSPNQDGTNDLFKAEIAKDVELISYEMMIFDRFGDNLYMTDNVYEGWNGTRMSEHLDPNVFVYMIKAKIVVCGEVMDIDKYGDVVLIR